MTAKEFEDILDTCCERLTAEARATGFKTSAQFENRVREVLRDLTSEDDSFHVDFDSPAQAFPDIALGEFGVMETIGIIVQGMLRTSRYPPKREVVRRTRIWRARNWWFRAPRPLVDAPSHPAISDARFPHKPRAEPTEAVVIHVLPPFHFGRVCGILWGVLETLMELDPKVQRIIDWRESIAVLPDSHFFEIIRMYLGEVKTPFNKQKLIEELGAFTFAEKNERLLNLGWRPILCRKGAAS